MSTQRPGIDSKMKESVKSSPFKNRFDDMPLQISSNKNNLQKRSQTPNVNPDDIPIKPMPKFDNESIPIKPMPKFDNESLGSGPAGECDAEAITIPE
jgi:hypothetical protein